LTESDFWTIPIEKISKATGHPNVDGGFMQWPIVRNGELWFRYYYTYYVRGPGIQPPAYGDCLVSLNLETWAPRIIPLDRPEFKRGFIYSSENRSFEVTSNAVYFVHNDQLLRRALDRPSWTVIPTTVTSPLLYLIHNRLYLSGVETIQQLLDDGTFKTLASIRRRPAVTPLDNLESLDRPPLHAATGDRFRAVLKDRQFLFDGANWKEEFTLGSGSHRKASAAPFFLAYGKSNGAALMWTAAAGGPQRLASTLDYDGPTLPAGPDWKMRYEQISFSEPFALGDMPAVILTRGTTFVFEFKQSPQFNVIAFPTKAPSPIHIPVELPKEKIPAFEHIAVLLNGGPFVVDSPRHLFFSAPDFPGLWRIPKAEITRRIEETIASYNRTNQPSQTPSTK
jgi:hypothetical protein